VLKRLIAQIGRPAAYLKNCGSELHKAADLLEPQGLASPCIDDISHAVATMLKRAYQHHPVFERFLSTCGRVSGKLKQTLLGVVVKSWRFVELCLSLYARRPLAQPCQSCTARIEANPKTKHVRLSSSGKDVWKKLGAVTRSTSPLYPTLMRFDRSLCERWSKTKENMGLPTATNGRNQYTLPKTDSRSTK